MVNPWSPISIVILKFPSTLNHCTCSMGSVFLSLALYHYDTIPAKAARGGTGLTVHNLRDAVRAVRKVCV